MILKTLFCIALAVLWYTDDMTGSVPFVINFLAFILMMFLFLLILAREVS